MSKYTIRRFTPDLYDKWNTFVESSNNGTLFHRLDFLEYHDEKFKENEHHLVWFKGGTIFAVMPMALFDEGNQLVAKTPYGASFGGIVYSNRLSLKNALLMIDLLVDYLKTNHISILYYTSSPLTYYDEYSNYIDFALLKSGFSFESRDVFNIVKLKAGFENVLNSFEGRARTTIKKHLNDFDIIEDASIDEFYPILIEDKNRHNNSKPTHLFEELKFLKQDFPDRIITDIAVHKQTKSKAGICYFILNNNTIMTFYMAQENMAKGLNGTNVLLYYGFKRAVEKNFKHFDFGSSTIGLTVQNIGVSMFKESFGANGYSRDVYKIGF